MTSRIPHRVLTCCDCGEEFVFTSDAQEYFADCGYDRDPQRCKSCFSTIKRSRPVDRRGADSALRYPTP
ncbi:MAG: zinc-ribbon domain-containing protein [candidate division Zixibacteria bacterium]|nr:zinc-ribbon domain-containing protein [candidate division Zixibacteria bacterium]